MTDLKTRPSYQQARYREGKPICWVCLVPCDPRSREYRSMGLCPYDYDDLLPLQTKPKELIPCKK